jgi:hypothetical protein
MQLSVSGQIFPRVLVAEFGLAAAATITNRDHRGPPRCKDLAAISPRRHG